MTWSSVVSPVGVDGAAGDAGAAGDGGVDVLVPKGFLEVHVTLGKDLGFVQV